MSALVGYETSSEEEEEEEEEETATAAPKAASTVETSAAPTSTTIESNLSNGTDVNTSAARVSEPATVGPLLGPSAPLNGDMINAESPTQAFEDMSERDTIRHLTQASIPMTSIPPSPPGSPDPAANAKFARFLGLKAKGVHFNEDLAKKSSFLNPALLAAMMARAGIDEADQYNTSLPLDLWSPKGFPEWAYKEELHKAQQAIRDKEVAEKKALSAAGKRAIEFAPSGGNSGDSSSRSTPSYQKKRRRP
ncbi:hypothetical protein EPUS_05837 [Endocarpon pusillum Z07020]|uniref:HCNGP-like protein n=1 Tax=Endocarpon pusillum (strain Z07020 / HMAS-L-300199) TaxID=1263415 RepID=U1I3G1_ENDPU|nr:uncharacterized protein EPUS_05837 [Endocarpon pusillum Z07020]ERF76564.1 hypothetical protein EPUS_05837 [Endocarpon pusillum Z07020]